MPRTSLLFAQTKSLRFVVFQALLLIALSSFLRSQALPAPYIVLVSPAGEPPETAEQGTQVTIYGTGFCPAGCSAVTLTIGNDLVKPITLVTLQADGNGAFNYTFTVQVPFASRYLITATQTSATGSTLSDSVPLIVPQSDEKPNNINTQEQEDEKSTPAKQRSASRRALTARGAGSMAGSDPGVSGVTEDAPNEAYDGRSVSVDVSASNDNVAIAASESGGLWLTTDAGAYWTPLTGLPTFRIFAVRMAPSNDQIVIATSQVDSHVTNGGGLWRSADGGNTWEKPATADPSPGVGSCPSLVNQWDLAFSPTTEDVYVATDCGLSISHDLGATWTHIAPDPSNPPIYSVVAQQGASGLIVDTCGADGHLRSTDGGTTWTSPSSALPACGPWDGHLIATSPLESNVLFAAIDTGCGTSLYESDDGGTSWTNLSVSGGSCGGRGVYVATHLSSDGNPKHMDIYVGNHLNTVRQTCTNTGGPGNRCSTSWSTVTVDHSDNAGLAFSTSSNCAQYMVTDGGVESTSDCGNSWTITGNGAGGYHALQIYEMNGEVHPGSTDLYIGTQDNSLWASPDNGSTWENPVCCEGFYIQNLHDSPSDSGQTITFVACSGCSNQESDADFVSAGGWNNPPGGGGSPFIISQGVYAQWSNPAKPTNQLYITTNTGSSWSPVNGATTTLQLVDHPFVTGPAVSPTIYQEVKRPSGNVGLIMITGVLSSLATVTEVDSGLGNIGYWSTGQGTFRYAQVFGVDPNNPNHLIAADDTANLMMVSTNGGTTWTPDMNLTNLVTDFGQFQFSQPSTSYPGITTEAHTIAFDPANSNLILVGTEQAGIIVSSDGGNTWNQIEGSSAIPAISSFFFDEVQNDVFASSYGRGLWKIDTSQIVLLPTLSVPGSLSMNACLGTSATTTLNACNTGQGNLIINDITSSSSQISVSTPSSGYPLTVSPDSCYPFQVNYTPTGVGTINGTLTISSNDPSHPNAAVAVTATTPAPQISTTIANNGNFGKLCSGQVSDLTLEVLNTGQCNLNIASVSSSSTQFSVPTGSLVLSADANVDLPVAFQPANYGSPGYVTCSNTVAETSNITIVSNDPVNPILIVPVQGIEGCPTMVLGPLNLTGTNDFPPTVSDPTGTLGCHTDKQITVSNTGICPLIIPKVVTVNGLDGKGLTLPPLPLEYTVVNTAFPIKVNPGGKPVPITVRFKPQILTDQNPTAPDQQTGTLDITSNDPIAADNTSALCGEPAYHSGARILLVDTLNNPISSVKELILTTTDITPPFNETLAPAPLQPPANVCGNTIYYHLDNETLNPTGNNPNAYYRVLVKDNPHYYPPVDFRLTQCQLQQIVIVRQY